AAGGGGGGGGGAESAPTAQTPLLRVIERENAVARSLLAQVRRDLAQLRAVCRGELKQTNHLRRLLADFGAGCVPRAWAGTYTVPRDCSLTAWVADFASRLEQSRELVERIERSRSQSHSSPGAAVREIQTHRVWLGGLLHPEAFVTATRQAVAKQLQCSLEELAISLSLDTSTSTSTGTSTSSGGDDPSSFAVSGLRIEGAAWLPDRRALALNDGAAERLGVCHLRWVRRSGSNAGGRAQHADPPAATAGIPVYLNADRSVLLFEATLPIDQSAGSSTTASAVVQRAVALIAA
ncbi:dynein heavy chain, partial [Coemansia sp. RSA 2049]